MSDRFFGSRGNSYIQRARFSPPHPLGRFPQDAVEFGAVQLRAALYHRADSRRVPDVSQRIGFQEDRVGYLTGLDRSELARLIQKLSGV